MYMKPLFLVAFIFLTSTITSQESISKKDKKKTKKEQAFNELKPILEKLNFEFIATKANPQSGRQVDLSSHTAFLKIIGDSTEIELPYYGRVFSVAYGGSGGIKGSGKYKEYSLSENNKKLNYIIKFSAKCEDGNYNFILSISHSGSATLSLTSSQRSSISYYGNINEITNN